MMQYCSVMTFIVSPGYVQDYIGIKNSIKLENKREEDDYHQFEVFLKKAQSKNEIQESLLQDEPKTF